MATKYLCLFEDRWLLAVYDLIRDNFFSRKSGKFKALTHIKEERKTLAVNA